MIGERIRQRRRSRRLSLRALAEAAGVSAAAISNYETGKDVPGSSVLLSLARALDARVDYFFRSVSVDLGQPAYRKHCKVSQAKMATLESRVQDMVERYLETEGLFGEEVTPRFKPPVCFEEPVLDVREVERKADALRESWSIGVDPIDNLTELLEDHGIKVIYVDEDEGFDGCAYPDGDAPVIVVNGRKPGDRLRFDLAHELGHLLLTFPDDWDDKRRESAAHRFAGALLVPRSAAIMELGKKRATISLLELYSLKHKYGMSMQAWIHRASDLGIISAYASRRLWALFASRGWKRLEPEEEYPREHSRRQERPVSYTHLTLPTTPYV